MPTYQAQNKAEVPRRQLCRRTPISSSAVAKAAKVDPDHQPLWEYVRRTGGD